MSQSTQSQNSQARTSQSQNSQSQNSQAQNSQAQTFVVVDDHEMVLSGTVAALQKDYPSATIVTASTGKAAEEHVAMVKPDVVVVDLSIPYHPQDKAQSETGIQLLRTFMEQYPTLNIVVQSQHVRALVRLKPMIDMHEGGFTIVDKGLPTKEMLTKLGWSLQGLIYIPREMKKGLEVKPEWLDVLNFAFQNGLKDKAIAAQMNVSERTVRHYWTKVQDALGVYPDAEQNIRIQTELQAREQGLID